MFPAAIGKTGKLSRRPLVRTNVADMLKRRLKQAGYFKVVVEELFELVVHGKLFLFAAFLSKPEENVVFT